MVGTIMAGATVRLYRRLHDGNCRKLEFFCHKITSFLGEKVWEERIGEFFLVYSVMCKIARFIAEANGNTFGAQHFYHV